MKRYHDVASGSPAARLSQCPAQSVGRSSRLVKNETSSAGSAPAATSRSGNVGNRSGGSVVGGGASVWWTNPSSSSAPHTRALSTGRSSWVTSTRTELATRVWRLTRTSRSMSSKAATPRKCPTNETGRARPHAAPAARSASEAR